MSLLLQDGKFTVINDTGMEVECELLFSFESDVMGKTYVVYTDNTTDEEGNTRVFASIYSQVQNEGELRPLETETEWKLIEVLLEKLHRRYGN